MVFTLQRYIFRELLKIFVLAVVALTLMLSLGSILRPVREYGVGPGQVLHLIVYFMPITLTFVLPMAALFAASLTYGRFAADNELDACRASGINLFTLVYPGLSLAVLVAIVTLVLSFHIVPSFVGRAERAVKADARQILFRNIQRNGSYELPGGEYRIYADSADVENNRLVGAIVAKVEGGKVRQLITAESARVQFDTHRRFNEVSIMAHNVYRMDEEVGVYMEWLPVSAQFGSLLADDIKFKKIRQMQAIRQDFMLFYPVADRARAAYVRLSAELLAQGISSKIADAEDRFYRLRGREAETGREFYIDITADECVLGADNKISLSGNVTVLEYDGGSGQLVATWQCGRAVIEPAESAGPIPVTGLEMTLRNARVHSGSEPARLAYRHTFGQLEMPGQVADRLGGDVLAAVQSAGGYLREPSRKLEQMQAGLQELIAETQAEIKAEIHSRMVFGLGCISMILISIALGIRFRGGHLLSAFGASSAPAAVLIVCIMMGRNITKNPATEAIWGVSLMWVALAGLSVLALMLYRRLLKA